jgi:phosphoglycolate phosphatase
VELVKYLIFDFDGTVVASAQLYLNLCNELAEELKVKQLDMESIRSLSSMTIKERCKKIGIPLYKLPSLTLKIQDKIKHHINMLEWIEGMEEVLYKLKEKDYYLAVISSNSIHNIKHFFENKKFEFFKDVYSSKGLFNKYQIINKLIKKLGIKKNDVVYIGDEYRDILACKKSKIKIISVTWGFDSRDLLVSGNPDFIVDSPVELLNVIVNL